MAWRWAVASDYRFSLHKALCRILQLIIGMFGTGIALLCM